MPGVFRDPATGTYRYYSYNDYEERRRRDWDDRYQGRTPFGPALPPVWSPPPPSIQFAGVATPSAEPSPQAFDVEGFRADVVQWQDVAR